jgi:hypothetical protein
MAEGRVERVGAVMVTAAVVRVGAVMVTAAAVRASVRRFAASGARSRLLVARLPDESPRASRQA